MNPMSASHPSGVGDSLRLSTLSRDLLATYPFIPAPERDGGGPLHPVVIVGAGPVGLTLAMTLARAGIRCVVLENDDRVSSGSRALGLSRRTLEIWTALDAADLVVQFGKRWSGGRSFFAGQTILQFEMPDDPLMWHRPMLNLQQCYSEHFLVARVEASPLIDLRWQSRFAGLRQKGDHVWMEVETPQGKYALQARYVAACDGARSGVRAAMGLSLEGASYEADYVIADIELATDAPAERRCWFDPPSNPGLSVLMHGQPGGIWRLDYQLGAGEDPRQAIDPARAHQRIQQHLDYIGEHGAWRLDDVSHYPSTAVRCAASVTGGFSLPVMRRTSCRSSASEASIPEWRTRGVSASSWPRCCMVQPRRPCSMCTRRSGAPCSRRTPRPQTATPCS